MSENPSLTNRVGVVEIGSRGVRLGTHNLVERLSKCHGDFQRFSLALRKEVSKLNSFKIDANLCPIVLGSAGTKVAWIKVRKNLSDRYEPVKVHGQVISTESLNRLVEMAIKDPGGVRRVIDPVNPQSPEFETVMTGIVAISVFLKNLGKAEFKVSANGSRYGVVWMIAVYRKLGFDLPVAPNHQKFSLGHDSGGGEIA